MSETKLKTLQETTVVACAPDLCEFDPLSLVDMAAPPVISACGTPVNVVIIDGLLEGAASVWAADHTVSRCMRASQDHATWEGTSIGLGSRDGALKLGVRIALHCRHEAHTRWIIRRMREISVVERDQVAGEESDCGASPQDKTPVLTILGRDHRDSRSTKSRCAAGRSQRHLAGSS